MEIIGGRKNLSPQAAAMLHHSYSVVEQSKITSSSFYADLLFSVRDSSERKSSDLPGITDSDRMATPVESMDAAPCDSASETLDDGSGCNAHYDPLMRTYLCQLQGMSLHEKSEDQTFSKQVEEIVENLTRSLCYPLTKFIQDKVHSHFRDHHQKVRS